ncbi:hypothetical protein I4F81_010970 [Pyropia yezoensis]|uniref:Uncharacterized protein n=1 Tax=Pyropia yezoensis TaxID=2788 RepID=A0ACC3CE85_PYRYE|nr:hypothetical protein I4F81_010970 [Neopyropia yezoensis]
MGMAFARLSAAAVLLAATSLAAVGAPTAGAPTAVAAPRVAASSRALAAAAAPSGGANAAVEPTLRFFSGGRRVVWLEPLLNEERARNGRSRLGTRGDLQANAEGHAAAMANSGRIYHQSLGPLVGAWGASWVSENVASNGVGAGASGLVQQWMNSPGHRTNLLSERATITGCGVATRNGQNFAACVYAAA